MAVARTNLTLPEDLLREVDDIAGPRGRSRYVADAVAQRVKRDKLAEVLRETRGAMAGKPGWRSPEEITRWVEELRSEDREERTEHGERNAGPGGQRDERLASRPADSDRRGE